MHISVVLQQAPQHTIIQFDLPNTIEMNVVSSAKYSIREN